MRFSYFLLVATATILASSNAIAATSGDQAKLSKMISTDAAVPARELESSGSQRFLPSYREEDEKDEEEEEERAMTPAQLTKWTARAEYWVERGYSPSNIRDKLTGLNGKMNAKDAEKYRLFGVAWARANPGEVGRM
ncbi:hypothetical protein V7S43_016844 [Phytophthora oleae]|uniref:RxLR effector protein n=1 Tax=Phytophthora oleae TaxID=2107226 RepID=A0ABD3EVM8_9STRA